MYKSYPARRWGVFSYSFITSVAALYPPCVTKWRKNYCRTGTGNCGRRITAPVFYWSSYATDAFAFFPCLIDLSRVSYQASWEIFCKLSITFDHGPGSKLTNKCQNVRKIRSFIWACPQDPWIHIRRPTDWDIQFTSFRRLWRQLNIKIEPLQVQGSTPESWISRLLKR